MLTPRRPRILAAATVLLIAGTLEGTVSYARDDAEPQPAPVTTEQALKEYREVIIALYGPHDPNSSDQTDSCPE